MSVRAVSYNEQRRRPEALKHELLWRNVQSILERDHNNLELESVGPLHAMGVMAEAYWLTSRFMTATRDRFVGQEIRNIDNFLGIYTGGKSNTDMEKVEKKWDKIDEETSNTLFTYWDKMNEPLSAEDQNRVNTVEKALNDNFNNKSNGGKAKARASKPKVYVGPKGGKYTLRKDGSKKYL